MATINMTKENFEELLVKSEIVFIEFWAEWCGPCKSFAEIYEKVARDFSEITFTRINIEEQKELAQDFNVRSIPFIVVLKRNIVIFSETGLLPEQVLRELVTQAKDADTSELEKVIKDQEGE